MAEISTVALITARPGRGDELEGLLRPLAEATHGAPRAIDAAVLGVRLAARRKRQAGQR